MESKEKNIHERVMDYFVDLEKLKTEKYNNIICEESPTISRLNGSKITIDDIPVFTKNETMENLLFGLASSRLYKELGIATPQTAPIITNQNNILVGSQSVLGLLDQNISTIMACKTLQLLSTDEDISDNIPCETSNKWYVLYNKQFRQKLLDIMTEDCFDQYTTLLIADELRTDTDRHWRNFFFYKSPESEKYEGIIPIDLEYEQLFHVGRGDKDPFKSFLKRSYKSYDFYNVRDAYQPYPERLSKIINLLDFDILTTKQIESIKKFLTHNLAQSIKDAGEKYDLQYFAIEPYEKLSRLQEYNIQHLGRSLGL